MANHKLLSDLQAMSAFVHSVESGNFSAAALRLGLSKSAIAKRIARLEHQLGVRLLYRSTRQIHLTAEGQLYYQSCLQIFNELDGIESLLSSQTQQVSGRIHINLPLSFGRLHIMPIVAKLAQRHPQLKFELSFSDRNIDLFEEGVDLVVRLAALDNYAHLIGRQIAVQRSVLCAAPYYLQQHGIPSTIAQLIQHDCLGFCKYGKVLPWYLGDSKAQIQAIKIPTRHIVSHGEALKDATLNAMGIAYLPTWLISEELRTQQLAIIPIETIDYDFPITALWPKTKTLAPKIRVVVDALIETFLPQPEWESHSPSTQPWQTQHRDGH